MQFSALFVIAWPVVVHAAVVDSVCDVDCLNDDGCDIIRQVDTQKKGDSPNDYTKGKPYFANIAAADQQKWMGRLDNNTKVADLYIPGTHDSGSIASVDTKYDWQYRCQSWSWQRQLDAGIRFFDVRVKWNPCGDYCTNQDLPIHHGTAEQKPPHFKQTMKIIKDFLTSNPTEFIIVRLKDEDSKNQPSDANTCCPALGKNWNEGVWKIINNSGVVYDRNFNYSQGVREARGKVLAAPFASCSPDCTHEAKYNKEIQDDWNPGDLSAVNPVPANGFPKKWDSITKFNAKTREPGKLYVSFLSGVWITDTDFPKPPMELAYGINGRFWNDFSTPKWKKAIYIFDFPGTEVIKQVIKANFGTVTVPADKDKHILRAERNKGKSVLTKAFNIGLSLKNLGCSQIGGKKNMGGRDDDEGSQIGFHWAILLPILACQVF